jgi:succinate dehydrogenase / fumarate reductase membrane anchor subunit
MTMQTPLGRVRGLGSAKEGVAHWWAQRVTAVALVPLSLWFVASIVRLAGADHALVLEWLGSPLSAAMMILVIVATLHHAQLGLQVVIEDYVHREGLKVAAILMIKGTAILLATAAIVAILKIALRS